MTPATVQELIWHFAGYLQLPLPDLYSVKIVYEGGGGYYVGQTSPANVTDTPWINGPEVKFGGLSDPILPAHGDNPFHLFHLGKELPLQEHLPHLHLYAPYDSLPLYPSDVGGGGGDNITITVAYQPGGVQDLIDLHQVNYLVNDGQVNAPPEVVALNEMHATDMLNWMTDKAVDQVPTFLQPASDDTTALKAFVDANDANPHAWDSATAPYSVDPGQVDPGQFVNGVAVTDGSDPHQVTNDLLNTLNNAVNQDFAGPPAGPTGDHQYDSIQTINVGSNISANDAVINNFGAYSTSLAVQGNYYETQEVVQTNVFVDSDHFTGSGSVTTAANTIDNIADMQNQVPTLSSGGTGTTATGLNWSVDVLHGNLLDLHSLVQTNYLSNNNVVYQTSSGGDSLIIAGANTQSNAAEFDNLPNYDLIIVEGSFHQDDLIYQTNVTFDSNNVTFNGGGYASESATAGGNSVVNDATIVDAGNHSFQGETAAAQSVIQSLENQSGSVDPAAVAAAFPELFGNINILVVTGDYYDVNYISQTNVMSNSNVVALNGSQSAPAGATQSVQTGHDITLNDATIVDGGSATSPYLQGSYYSDSILLQTNVIGDDHTITTQNPSQLAPELVAFTSPIEGVTTQTDAAPSTLDSQHQNDGLGHVMS